jgi:hypothetical protein
MEENSPKMSSINYVKIMEYEDTSQLEELFNKMEWLKGKTKLYKKWPKLC